MMAVMTAEVATMLDRFTPDMRHQTTIQAMKQAVTVPVTVKCRIGIDDQDPEPALDTLTAAVRAAGVDALIETGPSEEELDEYIGRYGAMAQQPVVLH